MIYGLISLSYPFQLTTPPEAKKYFNFRYPPPGEERVFYGRANDPQIAPYLTHGIRSKISMPVNLSFFFLINLHCIINLPSSKVVQIKV